MPSSESRMMMGADSTILQYVESYKAEELTYDAFSLKQAFVDQTGKKLVVSGDNLLVKYMAELRDLKEKITLSEVDHKKYMYNPKRMSFDLYGTTELWALLLDINELVSAGQFNLKTLWVFPVSIVDKLQRVLNLESDIKDYNAEELAKALLSDQK